MYLNTVLIRRRRQELGLSLRHLAVALRVSPEVIRRLEAGDNHDDLPLRFVIGLAEVLAVDPGTLFPEPEDAGDEPSPGDHRDDAAVLGALLHASDTLTPVDTLCELTGWKLDRVNVGLTHLDERLRWAGLRVHRLQTRRSIQRALEPAGPGLVQKAVRRHLARDGLNLTEARLLRRVLDRNIPKEPTNPEQVALGVLINAGLIDLGEPDGEKSQAPWVVAEDVRYSLIPHSGRGSTIPTF